MFLSGSGDVREIEKNAWHVSWPTSLLSYDACLVCWTNSAFGGITGGENVRPHFPHPYTLGKRWFFFVSRTSMKRFGGQVLWLLWVGRLGILVLCYQYGGS